jgi:hypothetical protein
MSAYKGTVVLTGMISPTDTIDTYPTHEDSLGKGGYYTVELLVDRDTIPQERQKIGMLCYVREDNETYILESINNWKLYSNYLATRINTNPAALWAYDSAEGFEITSWLTDENSKILAAKSCFTNPSLTTTYGSSTTTPTTPVSTTWANPLDTNNDGYNDVTGLSMPAIDYTDLINQLQIILAGLTPTLIDTIYNTINNYIVTNNSTIATKTSAQVYNDIISILQTSNPGVFSGIIVTPTTLTTPSIF